MLKIACVQFAPTYRDVPANLNRIRSFVHEANADVIVLPELAFTGYFFRSKEEIASLAQLIDGPLASELSMLARTEQKAIISGFLEREGELYFNASLAFDRNGSLVGHYRKSHLFYYETQIFSRGNIGFPVFSLETRSGMAKAGMMICYDWRFPEAARSLALGGAEFIALPSNIVTTTGMLRTTLQTRAFENKIVLAFADRVGRESILDESLEFQGGSAIIDCNGDVLSSGSKTEEKIVWAEVDLEKTRSKRINAFNDIFSDRMNYGL